MSQIREAVPEPIINQLEDDCIEILLERNGITVRKVVSSWHLRAASNKPTRVGLEVIMKTAKCAVTPTTH